MYHIKYILFLPFLFIVVISDAQQVYTVKNFSPDFSAKIKIEDTSNQRHKGWIGIYDKKTNKQLIRVNNSNIHIELHNGKVVANIKELYYGEQSIIMYEDFNFDGIKDLAIEEGPYSCYGGPSYRIYIGNGSGFAFNKAFSKLAQEYCGMFEVDTINKRLKTMAKGGPAWHEYSEFAVINNVPKAVKIETDDQSFCPYQIYTLETWDGVKMVTKITNTVQRDFFDTPNVVMSFAIGEHKKAVLFNCGYTFLQYALVKYDTIVEFYHPISWPIDRVDFKIANSIDRRIVTFSNKQAEYNVYENNYTGDCGVIVRSKGKSYDLKGIPGTKTGSLKPLYSDEYTNVTY